VIFTLAKLLKILMPYIKEKQLSEFDLNLFYSFYNNFYSVENKPDPPTIVQKCVDVGSHHSLEQNEEVNDKSSLDDIKASEIQLEAKEKDDHNSVVSEIQLAVNEGI